ncbi:hypothetical protein F4861DRAFT_128717 [Xylaria intraflava]|nr:hypothetical protein F4861DRAFT_128717 [Xylaria intraflava]
MDPNGVPPTHPYRVSEGYIRYTIVSGVLAAVASIAVAIRLIHRRRAGDLWWDDWTIILSLIFGLGVFICNVLVAVPSLGGAGYPIVTYPIEQLRLWAKISLAAEILYNPSVSLSRASLLLFYWRIFSVNGSVLTAARILFFVLSGQLAGSILGLIFSYNPVQAQWVLTIPYTTINVKAFYVATGVIKASIDVCLIWLAIGQLMKLQLSKERKWLLSALFLFTILTIIATVVRISYLATADLGNATESLTESGIWLNVEMFSAIINACLPGMYAFFRTAFLGGRSKKVSRPSRTDIPRKSLVTIGSSQPQYKRNVNDEENSLPLGNVGYEVICESGGDGETHSMAPLAPVRVDMELRVENGPR